MYEYVRSIKLPDSDEWSGPTNQPSRSAASWAGSFRAHRGVGARKGVEQNGMERMEENEKTTSSYRAACLPAGKAAKSSSIRTYSNISACSCAISVAVLGAYLVEIVSSGHPTPRRRQSRRSHEPGEGGCGFRLASARKSHTNQQRHGTHNGEKRRRATIEGTDV